MTVGNREIQMYGSPKADILKSVEGSLTYKLSGIGMIICGYMSDIQEMNDRNENGNYTETIRQTLNICKMLMMEKNLGFENNSLE